MLRTRLVRSRAKLRRRPSRWMWARRDKRDHVLRRGKRAHLLLGSFPLGGLLLGLRAGLPPGLVVLLVLLQVLVPLAVALSTLLVVVGVRRRLLVKSTGCQSAATVRTTLKWRRRRRILPTCDVSSWPSSCASWTFYSFSLCCGEENVSKCQRLVYFLVPREPLTRLAAGRALRRRLGLRSLLLLVVLLLLGLGALATTTATQ